MSINRKNLMLCIISLTVGGMLYLLFRERSYISLFTQGLIDLKAIRGSFSGLECSFIKYYFPDHIWAFSLCCGLFSLFPPKKKFLFACAALVFSLGLLWEFLQYTNILSGTGDIIDVIMYLTASIGAVLINILFLRRKI